MSGNTSSEAAAPDDDAAAGRSVRPGSRLVVVVATVAFLIFDLTVFRPFSGRRDGGRRLLRRFRTVCCRCASDVSLAGEDVDELDAYAARRREARIAIGHGYDEAEHRTRSMPEQIRGRKAKAFRAPSARTA